MSAALSETAKQWAAVKTQFCAIMEPPQSPPMMSRATCQGCWLMSVFSPPTMRRGSLHGSCARKRSAELASKRVPATSEIMRPGIGMENFPALVYFHQCIACYVSELCAVALDKHPRALLTPDRNAGP